MIVAAFLFLLLQTLSPVEQVIIVYISNCSKFCSTENVAFMFTCSALKVVDTACEFIGMLEKQSNISDQKLVIKVELVSEKAAK